MIGWSCSLVLYLLGVVALPSSRAQLFGFRNFVDSIRATVQENLEDVTETVTTSLQTVQELIEQESLTPMDVVAESVNVLSSIVSNTVEATAEIEQATTEFVEEIPLEDVAVLLPEFLEEVAEGLSDGQGLVESVVESTVEVVGPSVADSILPALILQFLQALDPLDVTAYTDSDSDSDSDSVSVVVDLGPLEVDGCGVSLVTVETSLLTVEGASDLDVSLETQSLDWHESGIVGAFSIQEGTLLEALNLTLAGSVVVEACGREESFDAVVTIHNSSLTADCQMWVDEVSLDSFVISNVWIENVTVTFAHLSLQTTGLEPFTTTIDDADVDAMEEEFLSVVNATVVALLGTVDETLNDALSGLMPIPIDLTNL